MNAVSTLGIELAKNTFSVHGVDAAGMVTVRRTVSRRKLTELVLRLPPCLIPHGGLLAQLRSGRSHSEADGTEIRRALRKSGKNDGNDAEAICEAVARPNMRFVPIKSVQQQADLSLHRVRQGFVEERTATFNRICGLIAEFGYVLPLALSNFATRCRS
jgi:transposase